MSEQQKMQLGQLRQADFAMWETVLYLDGHPSCMEALRYFASAKDKAKAARRTYEEQYGPLTVFAAGGDTYFNWNEAPLPWEWEAN